MRHKSANCANLLTMGSNGSFVNQTETRQTGHQSNNEGSNNMAKQPTKIAVETLTHDEATRKNIPTAEHQSIMHDAQEPGAHCI